MRAIQSSPPIDTTRAGNADWMYRFLDSLARADLSPATLRGYRYDLQHFLAWHASVQQEAFELDRLAAFELIAYRQHLLAAGRRPATINRRLDALRHWAQGAGRLGGDVTRGLRPVRTVRNRQPVGLTDSEVHALLRAGRVHSRPRRTQLRCRAVAWMEKSSCAELICRLE